MMVDDDQVTDHREVSHLPAGWAEWSRTRQVSYLTSTSTRRGLYLTLAEIADFHPRPGAKELTLEELAAVVVALVENPRVDPTNVRRFE